MNYQVMTNLYTNLEQSKLLKDWGAPPSPEYNWIGLQHQETGRESERVFHKSYQFELDDEWKRYAIKRLSPAYTLGELIDWLGDSFSAINYKGNSRFNSFSIHGKKRDIEDSRACGNGDNPLEAVFNLCRALHENREA